MAIISPIQSNNKARKIARISKRWVGVPESVNKHTLMKENYFVAFKEKKVIAIITPSQTECYAESETIRREIIEQLRSA